MKQGVLTNQRVRLLLSKGHSCYRPRRTGERKRKSVRGCVVDGNLAVLAMAIVKKGDADVREYVIKRPLPQKEGKKQKFKAPKIQRLVTPAVLQRKRHKVALKRRRSEKNCLAAAEYSKILAQRQK